LQKNGIEKCKFQKGENNSRKANENNLERGTGDKWRTIGKNKGKLEEDTHNLWKNIAKNATLEKGTCHMQHNRNNKSTWTG
jgi:hypothetical protein